MEIRFPCTLEVEVRFAVGLTGSFATLLDLIFKQSLVLDFSNCALQLISLVCTHTAIPFFKVASNHYPIHTHLPCDSDVRNTELRRATTLQHIPYPYFRPLLLLYFPPRHLTLLDEHDVYQKSAALS